MSVRKNRSDEELRMRELVVDKLRGQYPESRIIHELPLRYSTRRIDLAVVTETDIIAVEIKSSRDVVDRLEGQLRGFMPVTSKLIVALAPKWNPPRELVWEKTSTGEVCGSRPERSDAQEVIHRVGGHVETWTVCAESGTVEVTDGGLFRLQRPWAMCMLDMLWRAELLRVAAEHRICFRKNAPHLEIRNACEEYMTGREVRKAVCKALRQRDAFDKASDSAEGWLTAPTPVQSQRENEPNLISLMEAAE